MPDIIKKWISFLISYFRVKNDKRSASKMSNEKDEYRKEKLLKSTKKHEGEVRSGDHHVLYDDATGEPLESGDTIKGKPTSGWGRNMADRGINNEEAELMLKNDLEDFEKRCKARFEEFWEDLDGPRKNVLVEMSFNMGLAGVASFKNMLEAIKNEDYKKAAREMLNSKWAEQVGYRSAELAEQMRTGKYVTS